MKTIASVDKQASKLLKERRKSVAIDRDIVEGILTEMQSEMEHLKQLADSQNYVDESVVSHDSRPEFDELKSRFNGISHLISELSYNTDDTIKTAVEKLDKIKVNFKFFLNINLLPSCEDSLFKTRLKYDIFIRPERGFEPGVNEINKNYFSNVEPIVVAFKITQLQKIFIPFVFIHIKMKVLCQYIN